MEDRRGEVMRIQHKVLLHTVLGGATRYNPINVNMSKFPNLLNFLAMKSKCMSISREC